VLNNIALKVSSKNQKIVITTLDNKLAREVNSNSKPKSAEPVQSKGHHKHAIRSGENKL